MCRTSWRPDDTLALTGFHNVVHAIIGNIELSGDIYYENIDAADKEESKDNETNQDEYRDHLLGDDNMDAEEKE
jgi:hypothetical protein